MLKNKMTEFLSVLDKHPKGHILVQFVKFGMVGVLNTLLSLVITYVILGIFRMGFGIDTTWSLNVATTGGYVGGVCNSYYWNKKYVFKDRTEQNERKAFLKVCVCYGATYLLSMLLMDLMVEQMGVPRIIAPIPRLLLTIPLNFAANKLWAYKDRK